MKFKSIFIILALAMLMLTGVAWAEDDDDQGDNDDNPFSSLNSDCDYLTIINAPSTTYPIIAEYFQEGGCEIVYNKVQVKTCTLNSDCDKSEEESTLGLIAAAQAATIPSEALVCAVCTNYPEDYLTDLLPQVAERLGIAISEGRFDFDARVELVFHGLKPPK